VTVLLIILEIFKTILSSLSYSNLTNARRLQLCQVGQQFFWSSTEA